MIRVSGIDSILIENISLLNRRMCKVHAYIRDDIIIFCTSPFCDLKSETIILSNYLTLIIASPLSLSVARTKSKIAT